MAKYLSSVKFKTEIMLITLKIILFQLKDIYNSKVRKYNKYYLYNINRYLRFTIQKSENTINTTYIT